MRKPVYAHMRTTKAHLRSLISAFVVRCLDSIISLLSTCISDISNLYIASVAVQACLSLTWSKTLKTGFLVTWLNYYIHVLTCISPTTCLTSVVFCLLISCISKYTGSMWFLLLLTKYGWPVLSKLSENNDKISFHFWR